MRKPESYWNSDDEDEGPRTYRNVRPTAVGIERGGGHNHVSAMHTDYVESRQAMTEIDKAIQHRLWLIKMHEMELSEESDEQVAITEDEIDNLQREIRQLRRQWSFYANNYHAYDDVSNGEYGLPLSIQAIEHLAHTS